MDRTVRIALLKRVIVALAAAQMPASTPVVAGGSVQEPLRVEMSLASSSVAAGEPIVLNYRIANSSDQESAVYLGQVWQKGEGWLTVSLIDGRGRSVANAPDMRPRVRNPKTTAPSIALLSPHSAHEGQLIVNSRFDNINPGSYRLMIRAHLPFALSPAGSDVPLQGLSREDLSVPALKKEFTLPLMVKRADSQRLLATAQTLGSSLLDPTYPGDKSPLIQALFSMPPRYAMPVWRAVIDNPGGVVGPVAYGALIGQLDRMNSAVAADLLAYMVWQSKGAGSSAVDVRYLLLEKHEQGGAVLKKHIESLFVRYEGKMPKKNDRVIGYP